MLMITLLVGTVVYAAWEFYFPIAIQDTSGSARTHYQVLFDFGGQSLIDAGKIDADALDTNMQIGSTDIKFMIASDNVTAVIPSLPSGGVVTTNLYTGYTPEQVTFPIITGEGGYVTVVDADNPVLRLGDEFVVVQRGWWNTSPYGANKNAAIKASAFQLYNSSTDNITAIVNPGGASTIVETTVTSGEYTIAVSANTTTLHLWVDSGAGFVLEDSAPLAAGAAENANGWVLGQNEVMPYMDYFKIWVR